jgi:hypothetical protein
MDGTKSSVVTTENHAPAADQKAPSVDAPPKPVEESIKPATPTPEPAKPVEKLSSRTILKPGSGAINSQLKLNGPGSRGADKPTLVAKPSAPATVKSPWATLPQIEKVSPVTINPPTQTQPPPPQPPPSGDARAYDRGPSPIRSPAKEIAADDFNRSWRDDRGTKELFDSKSGRYEPVNEQRRGSIRSDYQSRSPAVLRRPSPAQGGPAEPSAAFQTHRSSISEQPWGRRRASSNASAGSLGQLRRMSINRADSVAVHDPHPHGPPSVSSNDHSAAGYTRAPYQQKPPYDRVVSPSSSHASWAQHSSPAASSVQPVSPYQAAPAAPAAAGAAPPSFQDDVLRQEKLMKAEGLERARLEKQRRLEEERKEEAEKKERLRLKLAGLEKQIKPTEPEELPAPARTQEPGQTGSAPREMEKRTGEQTAFSPGDRRKPVGPPSPSKLPSSPPKPPKPSAGQVSQYGLMKVHQPQPLVQPSSHPPENKGADSLANQSSAKSSPNKGLAAPAGQSSGSGPNLSSQRPGVNLGHDSASSIQKPFASSASHWRAAPPRTDGYSQSTWGANSLTSQPAGNVWAPINSDRERSLGNGVFDTTYNRVNQLPSQQQSVSRTSLPPPPSVASHSIPPAANPHSMPSSVNPTPSNVPTQPQSVSSIVDQSSRPTVADTPHHPGTIAPPSRSSGPPAVAADSMRANATPSTMGNLPVHRGWSNWKQSIQNTDNMPLDKASEAFANERPVGEGEYNNWNPKLKTKFVQIEKGRRVSSRNSVANSVDTYSKDSLPGISSIPEYKDGHDGSATAQGAPHMRQRGAAGTKPDGDRSRPLGPHHGKAYADQQSKGDAITATGDAIAALTDRDIPMPPMVSTVPPAAVSSTTAFPPSLRAGQSSRFFPTRHQDSHVQIRSEVPPPTDSQSHPVNDGDINHPKVSLPRFRETARVRLPPASSHPLKTKPDAPASGASQPQFGSITPALVKTTAWQQRFNDLFQKPSVEMPRGGPVAPLLSASKAPITESRASATVSLPSPARVHHPIDLLTRHTEDLDDEFQSREFGSKPTIYLPRAAHKNANLEPVQPSNKHIAVKPHDVRAVEPYTERPELTLNGNNYIFHVRVPGHIAKDLISKRPVSKADKAKWNRKNKPSRPSLSKETKGKRPSSVQGPSEDGHSEINSRPASRSHRSSGPPSRGTSRRTSYARSQSNRNSTVPNGLSFKDTRVPGTTS